MIDKTSTCYDVIFINPCHHGDGYYAPIGLNMLHRLVCEAGFRSQIIDLQREVLEGAISWPKGFFVEAEARLRGAVAKIYAFSVMNVGLPWAVRVAKIIRRRQPEAKIIFGGPQATLACEELLKHFPVIDVVARYEGERIIVPLITALLAGNRNGLRQLPNLALRNEDGSLHVSPRDQLIDDLDTLPLMELDIGTLDRVPLLSVEAGRGCPYFCSFCSSHAIWTRAPRFKSGSRLVDEVMYYLRDLPSSQYPIISFEHDDFLANRKVFRSFVEIKAKRNAEFRYLISSRLNHLTREVIGLLRSSGCVSVFMGLETGEQRLQEISSKSLNVSAILPTVITLRQAGLHFSTNFIVGFPEERFEDVVTSLDLMFKLAWLGATVNISTMCPEPGSALHGRISADRYLLLPNSTYARELREGGIDIESLTNPERYHLLTIHNDHYDIREVVDLAACATKLMMEFPGTLFWLFNRRGLGSKGVVQSILAFLRSGYTTIDAGNIDEFVRCASLGEDWRHERWGEYLLYEKNRSIVKSGGKPTVQAHEFATDMPGAYFTMLSDVAARVVA